MMALSLSIEIIYPATKFKRIIYNFYFLHRHFQLITKFVHFFATTISAANRAYKGYFYSFRISTSDPLKFLYICRKTSVFQIVSTKQTVKMVLERIK